MRTSRAAFRTWKPFPIWNRLSKEHTGNRLNSTEYRLTGAFRPIRYTLNARADQPQDSEISPRWSNSLWGERSGRKAEGGKGAEEGLMRRTRLDDKLEISRRCAREQTGYLRSIGTACLLAVLAGAPFVTGSPLRADTVVLRNGNQIHGEILRLSDREIVMRLGRGTVSYKFSQVKTYADRGSLAPYFAESKEDTATKAKQHARPIVRDEQAEARLRRRREEEALAGGSLSLPPLELLRQAKRVAAQPLPSGRSERAGRPSFQSDRSPNPTPQDAAPLEIIPRSTKIDSGKPSFAADSIRGVPTNPARDLGRTTTTLDAPVVIEAGRLAELSNASPDEFAKKARAMAATANPDDVRSLQDFVERGLRDGRSGGKKVAIALESLAELKSAETLETIQRALRESRDPAVRALAARAIGEYGIDAGFESLQESVTDPSAGVRRAVARSLGQLGKPGAGRLLKSLYDDADESTRVEAIRALRKLGDRSAIPVFIEALRQKSTAVEAASALGELETNVAVDALLVTAGDAEDPMARERAVEALGKIGDAGATPRLLDLLGSSPELDRSVVDALARIHPDSSAGKDPSAWREWSRSVSE